MRRTALLAACLALALTGVAGAAVSYKTGTYKAGSAKGTGVNLKVSKGKFSVSRISFKETCTSANDEFSDHFQFLKGSNAKLNGKISSKCKLSGSYTGPGGSVKITGSIKGSAATVKGSEHGTYSPQGSTTHYDCSGSHTFTAKLAK
jgi:hypothetical protein